MSFCVVTFKVTIYTHYSNAFDCIVAFLSMVHTTILIFLFYCGNVHDERKVIYYLYLFVSISALRQTIYCEKGRNLCQVIKWHKKQVEAAEKSAHSVFSLADLNLNLYHIFQFIADSLLKFAHNEHTYVFIVPIVDSFHIFLISTSAKRPTHSKPFLSICTCTMYLHCTFLHSFAPHILFSPILFRYQCECTHIAMYIVYEVCENRDRIENCRYIRNLMPL